jgi:iron complex transport system substrate-binding protein
VTRRNLFAIVVAALCPTLALVWPASAESFTDAAGRKVELPATINRIMPAGPPAAVLLYALAPDRMTGWVKQPTEAEKAFLAAPWRDLPVAGRLTGSESSADAETVRKIKPDLIIDVGAVDAEYAALADRIQKETDVPYILLDGSFEKTPETLRLLGKLLGREAEAVVLANYAEAIVGSIYAPQTDPPGFPPKGSVSTTAAAGTGW